MPAQDWWIPPRSGETELMDRPETSWEDVLGGMRDVQRINTLLLSYPLLALTFWRLARWPEGRPMRVLDVGTGLADKPTALVDLARRQGRAIEVVGLDLNPRILSMAAERVAGYPEIRLVEGDGLALPFEDGHFDWAMTHLALHHVPPAHHVRFLQEMDRVIRPGGGLIVGDLERSYPNLLAARVFLGLVSATIAHDDGIVSVQNALSGPELAQLVTQTGLGYLGREWLAPPAQFILAGVKPLS